ncbi:MAG: Rrf2 family transcriptional regulator [Bacteroidales bacterium]|nr:Rrf2 family transcriptional regulator [Bacteroidales bacterium]
MLSNTCKYAIRAAIFLALNSGDKRKIGIKLISKELDLPSPFLSKILQTLAKNKVFSSSKGPNGGFGLAKNANDISLFEIVEIIDGNDLFNLCLISTRTCMEKNQQCALHEKYSKIRSEIFNMFKSYSIGELAMEIKEGAKPYYL